MTESVIRPASSSVLLSQLLGRPVLGPSRQALGRVVDVTVALGEPHPVLRRVGTGSRRALTHLTAFAALDDTGRCVRTAGEPMVPVLHDRELRLVRDVLDTQVVDLDGRRLCRVSDVLLGRRPDGGAEVVAVDVGLGALLGRVGLRWLGSRFTPALVDWDDLHLTSTRGHLVQLSTATAGMRRLDSAGVAHLVARLSAGQAADVLDVLDPAVTAAALGVSQRSHRERLLHLLPARRVAAVTASASPEVRGHLLAAAHAPERRRHLRTSGWRRHLPGPSDPGGPPAPDGPR
jgi:sporulation protein YlmC with PRC-barrel domain